MGKIIKGFWLLTLLLVFSLLMYVYASLPEAVYYSEINYIDNNSFFYIALAIIAFVNFPLYAISRSFKKPQALAQAMYGWIFALATVCNGFLFVALQYVNLFNSTERVSFSYYAYYLYICLAFLVGCIIALPILFIKNHKKQEV